MHEDGSLESLDSARHEKNFWIHSIIKFTIKTTPDKGISFLEPQKHTKQMKYSIYRGS